MGEDDDFNSTNDLFNQDLSSSTPFTISNNNGGVEDEQRKQNIISDFAYGKEPIPIIYEFAVICKSYFDLCIDKNGPFAIINVPYIKKMFEIFKINSIKKRIITEITSDNLGYCKQILEKYEVEIKHVSDIKCNFALFDDKEYLVFTMLQEKETLGEIIYSREKEIINQNQLVFESFWNEAMPAEQRIREIEERVIPLQTYLINNNTEALAYTQNLVNSAETGFLNLTPIDYFKLLYSNPTLFQSYLNNLSRYTVGKVKSDIRWITHIENNKEDIELIKKFLEFGIKIKHISNLPPLYLSVSQKQCIISIEYMPNAGMFQKIIFSTEPLYISHYQTVFEELWVLGIDAQERIRQLETGTILAITKIIENAVKTKQYFIDMVRNSREEILILFPSLNAVKREVIMGVIDLLKKKSIENVKIKILSPVNENVKEILLLDNVTHEYKTKVWKNIISREIRKQAYLISTIVIVDRKYVLATELKDDSKLLFEEAIGVSTYSTSKPTVLSYISIFESLWDQTEMSNSLKIANEKLIQSEQFEKEFINTAAHELRTPTQAVMGYAEIDIEAFEDLLENPKVTTDYELKRIISVLKEHFDAIYRNSSRLDELINNLLDIARIESNRGNGLQINKEKLDLVKEINDSIKTELVQKIKNKNIKINFINECLCGQCWIYADKLRLNQIINNLIGNAIKYTNQNGSINIIVKDDDYSLDKMELEKKKISMGSELPIVEKSETNKVKDEIFVSISDTGKGISPQIMPHIFEKFISSSNMGTGLGLYITRNLVEAHGGKIWAFNNKDGVGATFVFSLPKATMGIL